MKRTVHPDRSGECTREAEVLMGQGSAVGEATTKIGVTNETYCRWRKEYDGMRIDEVERLKRLVADLSLDIAILKGSK